MTGACPARTPPSRSSGRSFNLPPHLVDDPELRFTNNGTPVANLRVAVTQRVLEGGAWRDGQTSFFRVNAWRETAIHLAESLRKGDRVVVLGRLRQRTWESPEGERRSVAEIETRSARASSGRRPGSSGSRLVAARTHRGSNPAAAWSLADCLNRFSFHQRRSERATATHVPVVVPGLSVRMCTGDVRTTRPPQPRQAPCGGLHVARHVRPGSAARGEGHSDRPRVRAAPCPDPVGR